MLDRDRKVQKEVCYAIGKEKACGTKRRLENGTWAKECAKNASDNYGELMTEYLCPFCGYWHIGHKMDERAIVDIYLHRDEMLKNRLRKQMREQRNQR